MIGFLVRGLLRDRSRSLFPFLTVAVGVTLVVVMDAYLRGATDAMLQTTATFVCGHVRVATREHNRAGTDATNEQALLAADEVLAGLRRDYPDLIWTPRIRFGGLVDVPDSTGTTRTQSPAAGLAVDLSPASPERNLLRLAKSLASGRLPAAPGEILLSDAFARRLGVKVGDRMTLVSSTMNGGLAAYNFNLSGTVRFGVGAMDRAALLADINDIRRALDMPDGADEIIGFLPGNAYDDRHAARLARDYNAARPGGDDYAPEMLTMRDASGLGAMFDLIGAATALIVAIFVTAMAIVLWNAGLMGSLRRYGEIGIRLALGESKHRVYGSLLAEASLVGLAGSAVGTVVGLGLSYYLQEVGINISSMTATATMMIDDVLRARIAPASYFVGFVPGLLATFFGAAISGLGVYRRQTAQLAKEFSS